jgi:hypothetical protein
MWRTCQYLCRLVVVFFSFIFLQCQNELSFKGFRTKGPAHKNKKLFGASILQTSFLARSQFQIFSSLPETRFELLLLFDDFTECFFTPAARFSFAENGVEKRSSCPHLTTHPNVMFSRFYIALSLTIIKSASKMPPTLSQVTFVNILTFSFQLSSHNFATCSFITS